MNIRSMAQSQLMMEGFNYRSSSVPPAWQSKGNQPKSENISSNVAIRSAGDGIENAFKNMRGKDSAFGVMEGRSSDTDVATVKVDNSRATSSTLKETAIDVSQVATAQANAGDALVSGEKAVASGEYRFDITSGNKTYNFNINVTDKDDNASIQKKMADAVNARKIGVTASVSTAREGGENTSKLTISADKTGTDSTFSVSDGRGTLASAMGVTSVSTEAQNAVYSVNGGVERTSQSNDVNISAGVSATLRGEGTTDITFERNAKQAIDATKGLVNALNSALKNTDVNDGRGSERFKTDIIGMNTTFSASLSRVGINVQADGQLAIDENKLKKAAEDGSLAKMFENNGSSFAARADRIGKNAASGSYRNAPPPVNFTSPKNNFDFSNADNMWAMLNMLG